MSRTTGLVLDERAHIGSVSPAAAFEDRSRFKNNGTHTDITWVQLPSGIWVRSFNGTTSVVSLTNEGNFNFRDGIATISFWFLTASAISEFPISKFNGAGGWTIDVNNQVANKITMVIRTAVGAGAAVRSSTSSVNTGGWWKLDTILNFATPTVSVYLNGSLDQGALTAAGAVSYNTVAVQIGARMTPSTSFFDGSISLARIYSRALSAAEIAKHFTAERSWFNV